MTAIERLAIRLADTMSGDRLRIDEPLSRHTSFGIGGAADLYVVVKTQAELLECRKIAQAEDTLSLVIGEGTNILVADSGIRGMVIANTCDRVSKEDEGLIVAESGVLLRELARMAVTNGLCGLEWAVGIPGTLGGAVVGNAGAYGGCMADVVRWVTLLMPGGQVESVDVDALEYGYRTSALKREPAPYLRPIVLEVALALEPGDRQALAHKASKVAAQRRMRTPEGRCAGSVFKRTFQYPAGFLIDQAGLKGMRVGDAEISTKHANFLMNAGTASARDMKCLIDKVQREVWAAFAQRLEPEIEFLGDWSSESCEHQVVVDTVEGGEG